MDETSLLVKVAQQRLAEVITRWDRLPKDFREIVGLSVDEALRKAESALEFSEAALQRRAAAASRSRAPMRLVK